MAYSLEHDTRCYLDGLYPTGVVMTVQILFLLPRIDLRIVCGYAAKCSSQML